MTPRFKGAPLVARLVTAPVFMGGDPQRGTLS